MVKVGLIKAHHIKIEAVVFAVASGAVFARYGAGGVVACVFIYPGLDFGMAGEAFVVGYLLAQRMALRAV